MDRAAQDRRRDRERANQDIRTNENLIREKDEKVRKLDDYLYYSQEGQNLSGEKWSELAAEMDQLYIDIEKLHRQNEDIWNFIYSLDEADQQYHQHQEAINQERERKYQEEVQQRLDQLADDEATLQTMKQELNQKKQKFEQYNPEDPNAQKT